MKPVLVVALVVAMFFAVQFVVRFAVGFLRWVRANRGSVSLSVLIGYCQDQLGDWVDYVCDSPGWFPFEGHGHHDVTSHSDGGTDTGHGCSHGGDSICGD